MQNDAALKFRQAKELVQFVLLTFGITWSLQVPGVLAQAGLLPGGTEIYLPFVMLGVLGPMSAAWILTRRTRGKAGVKQLFQSLYTRRPALPWLLLALILPGLALTVPVLIARLVGYELPAFYPPKVLGAVVVALIISLGEEVGWRGYALPRLADTVGRVRGSLILGVIWAIWHIPMFIGLAVPLDTFPLMLGYFAAGSIVFSWLYFRTACSLLIAVLAHVGAHLNNSHQALPQDTMPLILHTVGLSALALALVVFDPKIWRPS